MFLEDIYWLFLGGNLNHFPSPLPGMAQHCDLQLAGLLQTLSSKAVSRPNGIKLPGLFGLWANTGEQWLVSSVSKGTCCFNITREYFSGVLLPRIFLSGPGPLSWSITASQPSPWPPPLPAPKHCARTLGHTNGLVSTEHEQHDLAQTMDSYPRAGQVSAGCVQTSPLQFLLQDVWRIFLETRLAA